MDSARVDPRPLDVKSAASRSLSPFAVDLSTHPNNMGPLLGRGAWTAGA